MLLTKAQQRAVAKAWARNIKRREDAALPTSAEPPSRPAEGPRPNSGQRTNTLPPPPQGDVS